VHTVKSGEDIRPR